MRRKRRRQKNARRKRRRRQRNCQNLQQTAHIEATAPVQNSVPQLETSAATNTSLQATGFLSAFPHLHFPSQQLQTQQHSSAQQHQQLPYGNMAAVNMNTVPPPPPYESPPEYQPSQGQFETRINIPDVDTNQFNMPPPPPPYDAHIQHSTPFQFK
ncbi:hypothetical protein CDAR_317501 [Caerostris darwini]|uniref:Uncharacterized protein n=1 Tax=Caerostris darwini TaxID=1538125 RepID=A0AAV4SI68_9ARAC|nr:hypothetical protein CDAR_317501 [Caerostris darwini]